MFMYKKTTVATFSGRPKQQMDLCSSLNSMRNKGKFCDLDLVANGKVFPIHKLVLAAASVYFDKMLSSNFVEKFSKSVDLTDVFPNTQTLRDILDYVYTGCIMIDDENYRDILNGASHFLLEDLRRKCSHYILVNLSPVNALQHWVLADMYGLEHLIDVCFYMIRARFHDFLIFREDALQIPICSLKQIIVQDAIVFLYKFEKLKFLLNWLSADLDNRCTAVRTLLEDEDVVTKLGLPESLTRGAIHIEPSNMMEILQEFVDQQEELIPKLESMTEALVGWYYKSNNERNTRILTVCAYVPTTNRWSTITKIRVDRQFGPLIGFINRQAIYKTMNGFLVVDLDDYTYERVGIPALQSTSGLRSQHVFLFDDKVFCLMEVSKYTRRGLPNGSQFLYPEAKGFLKVYSFETKQWSKVCDIPAPLQLGWIPLQFHTIQRKDYACCFVFAMSNVHSFQIRSPNDHWRINGPHLFLIKKKRTKYTMIKLEDPPVDEHEQIVLLYHSLRIVGLDSSILIYGATSEGDQNKEVLQGLLEYDIETEHWTELEERTIQFPNPLDCHLLGFHSTNIKVGNVATDGVQSLKLGNVYFLRYKFPFFSQFFASNLDTSEVVELAPPPLEKLKFFTVCQVPFAVLDGASTHYSDRFEKRLRSPMVDGHLEGNGSWTCVLESKLEPPSTSTTSLSHSSASSSSTNTSTSSSELEILDVEN